jgi:hypothetical protein
MPEFLGHQHHLPGGCEDRLIALLLPEVDIKRPVGRFATDDSGHHLVVLGFHGVLVCIYQAITRQLVILRGPRARD